MFETLLTPERVARETGTGYWHDRTITDFLDDRAAEMPDKVAFVDSRIGAVSNLLTPIYREREVGFMVGLAKSKLIVVPKEFRGFDYPGMVDRLRGDWPSPVDVLVVVGGWGQTEEGLVTLGIPGDPEEKIVETDGYPWPGMEVRVVDWEGKVVPPRTEGALEVRGPFLFVGYAERLEMTRELFVPDEAGDWFDTGDLAHLDEDGYLRISGRTKDVIIRGGENIPVAYVENVLYENPKIDSVAVIGIPDPRLQKRACACVVLKSEASELGFEEMQTYLAEKGVAKQYWPEKLLVLDDFPRTPSGKNQKFHLREQVVE